MTASGYQPFVSLGGEVRLVLSLALPSAVIMMLRIGQMITDQAVYGHMSTADGTPTALYLQSASLAMLWMQLTLAPVSKGINGAVGTLTSMAVGAGKTELVGAWLQIGLLFACAGGVVVGALWLLTPAVLSIFVEDREARELAGRYATISLGWILPQIWLEMTDSWLKGQRVIVPQLRSAFVAFGINVLLNFVLVAVVGFDGIPIATVGSRVIDLALIWFQLVRRGPRQAFLPWREVCERARVRTFVKQALPLSLTALLESIQLELVGMYAGGLGRVEIAAHATMLMTFMWLSAPIQGVSTQASNFRIGQHLGAGDTTSARLVAKVCFGLAVGVSFTLAASLILLRRQIGLLFSSDAHVVDEIVRLAPVVAAGYVEIGIFFAAMGVLTGQGRPVPAALAFLGGAFLLTPTTGYVYTFILGLGLLGIWYGLITGYTSTLMICAVALVRSDWEQITERARERSEVRLRRAGQTTSPASSTAAMVGDARPASSSCSGSSAPQMREVVRVPAVETYV